jgi:hypothetical protein
LRTRLLTSYLDVREQNGCYTIGRFVIMNDDDDGDNSNNNNKVITNRIKRSEHER